MAESEVGFNFPSAEARPQVLGIAASDDCSEWQIAKSRADIAARCQEVPREAFHAHGPGPRLACGPRSLGCHLLVWGGLGECNRQRKPERLKL